MFEGISKALGTTRAEVKSWASTQYAEAIGISAVGLYVEEAITSFITKALNLSGMKNIAVKELGRIAMSGLYYGFLRSWKPIVAITASAGPLLMVGADVINWAFGKNPTELGESLALKALGAWSKPTQTATKTSVIVGTPVSVSPAPAPAPSSEIMGF